MLTFKTTKLHQTNAKGTTQTEQCLSRFYGLSWIRRTFNDFGFLLCNALNLDDHGDNLRKHSDIPKTITRRHFRLKK